MMGTIWIPGSGGGIDLEVVNAKPEDLIAGKVIVDKDGNPLIGTMPVRGGVIANLNAGGSFDILNGYHNGQGRVIANSLASQTPGNTSPEHVRTGRTFWNNGVKGVGIMPEMAGVTINPTNGQQVVATGNKFVTSNVIVSPVSNLTPGNVKKGVQVGNVVGTWEGWVPTPSDLYLAGQNLAGLKPKANIGYDGGYCNFDTGQISYKSDWKTSFDLTTTNWYNTAGMSRFIFEGTFDFQTGVQAIPSAHMYVYYTPDGGASWTTWGRIDLNQFDTHTYIEIPVSARAATGPLMFRWSADFGQLGGRVTGAIRRIRMV